MRRLKLRNSCHLLTFIIGVIISAPWIVSWQRASGEIRPAGVEKKSHKIKSVTYRGVSFRYSPLLASDVKAAVLPAITLLGETDKPEGVSPEHIAFSLIGSYPSKHESSFFSPEIHIYSVAEYKKALDLSKSYVQQLEDDVRALKSMLSQRPASWKDEIPFLPFGIDASQSFRAHVKYIDFRNGTGVIFLTQYDIEPSLINDSGLAYVFQGLADDGVHYISATFPVSAPSLHLPTVYKVGSYEDYKLPDFFYGDNAKLNEKNYQAYRSKMISRLEKLSPNKYKPSLTLFEELIRSLSVQGQSNNGLQRTRR